MLCISEYATDFHGKTRKLRFTNCIKLKNIAMINSYHAFIKVFMLRKLISLPEIINED